MLELIETPRVSSSNSEFYGEFVIEPLERGFGATLGNALRRVLLSSLKGSAVTHIHIDGILHEFSTIPGVVEDVTEIVVNIKKLKLDLLTDYPKTLKIEVKGEGIVTAADIQPDPEVEILNPDLYIAELTDKDSRLSMELIVEKGKGYVAADKHDNSEQILGMIPIDSIFNPVVEAEYVVEDSRVGQVTNYDRLILKIETNGSILPHEALSTSADIIREYMGFFTDIKPPQVEGPSMAKSDADGEDQSLDMSIENLGLSVRSLNCLKRASIKVVRDLIAYSEDDLMKLKNFGQKSLDEIREKLEQYHLSLMPSSREE